VNITLEELKRRFPGASKSTLARNVAQCDHKFIDSNHCLRCGWIPPKDYYKRLEALLDKPISGGTEAGQRTAPASTEERLNKLEKRFLAELRSRTDRYTRIGIQDITLKLGWDTRYTPDFSADGIHSNTISLFEVKGFMRDDARVKLFAAAKQFPCFRFWLVQWIDGAWKETVIPA